MTFLYCLIFILCFLISGMFIDNHKLISLFFTVIGSIFLSMYGVEIREEAAEEAKIEAIKEYLNEKVEVDFRATTENGKIIKEDTIINFNNGESKSNISR